MGCEVEYEIGYVYAFGHKPTSRYTHSLPGPNTTRTSIAQVILWDRRPLLVCSRLVFDIVSVSDNWKR